MRSRPRWASARAARSRGCRDAQPALAIAAAVLLAVVSFAGSLRFNDRHRLYAAHDYAEEILRSVGPHGFLLTYDWEVYSPLLYELEVQQRRPDVVAVDAISFVAPGTSTISPAAIQI